MYIKHGHGHTELTDIQHGYEHRQAACSCPCCMSIPILQVHVFSICPCPFCKSISMLHVHALYLQPCCMFMPILNMGTGMDGHKRRHGHPHRHGHGHFNNHVHRHGPRYGQGHGHLEWTWT
jgi:hypothetical protein